MWEERERVRGSGKFVNSWKVIVLFLSDMVYKHDDIKAVRLKVCKG